VFNHHKCEHSPIFIRDGKLLTSRATGTSKAGQVDPVLAKMIPQRSLVMENVPVIYSDAMVFMELCAHGGNSFVEMLHLPKEEGGTNRGICYIAFFTEAAAQAFAQILEDADFSLSPGPLSMHVTPLTEERVRLAMAPPKSARRSRAKVSPGPISFEYTCSPSPVAPMIPPVSAPAPAALPSWDMLNFNFMNLDLNHAALTQFSAMVTAEDLNLPPSTSLRETRDVLPEKFGSLGVALDNTALDLDDTETPLFNPAFAYGASPYAGVTPSDFGYLLPAPFTPQRPIPSGKGATPEKTPEKYGRKYRSGSAITPPTTTAGSDASSNASNSPEPAPAMASFDLPSLLPSPDSLLTMSAPTPFPGFGPSIW